MAKLSASALRAAAASAREKSEENADTAVKKTVPEPVVEEPKPAPAKKKEKRETAPRKTEEAPVMSAALIHSQDGELKTEHVNLLITPSLSKKPTNEENAHCTSSKRGAERNSLARPHKRG